MSDKFNLELFNRMPVVGIMRNFPAQALTQTVNAFQAAGLNTLEITMNSPGAADTIRGLREARGSQMNIGAGTVCTIKDLNTALEAGAQFIVTPVTSKKVIKACVKANVPVFPGAMTPTEIYKAWQWGATMVKVFPAARFGPGYIKDVLEPLNGVKLIPTGGINADNFIDYLKLGASGAGIASALFPKDLINAQLWEDLRRLYDSIVQKYRDYNNAVLNPTTTAVTD